MKLNRALPLYIGVVLMAVQVQVQAADNSFYDALAATKPLIDLRMRYESVDQEPLSEEAEAATFRARLGFETGKVWATSLLAEGEFLTPINTDYNSTTNGKANYPVVPDRETYEINRLQLTNLSLPKTTVTLGRQRIVLDDHRFVGNVGWRQNEQTFDALRIVNKSVENITLDASYVEQVNRVFGKESPQGRYEGDTVLANVSYQWPIGKLTGFGYLLDFEAIPGVPAAVRDSSKTYGLRFAGEHPVGKVKVGYIASYASQDDYADNPVRFDNDYYLAELSGSIAQYTLGAGLEVLEGDGVKGFTTPLATLHKFQGWVDKFLTTPANGIEDRYVNVGANFKAVGPLDVLSALVSYHSYEAEHIASDYGDEINLQIIAKLKRYTATLKYGDYEADTLFSDTTKYWLQVDYTW
jgi:hypothetical protein